jgi:cytoskeletal protein RodZ
MKTAGEILKEAREKKQIKLDEVARGTKIRKPYLLAIEKDDYQSLPSATSSKGFIRNYAQFLGLKPERVVAAFKRDYRKSKEQKPVFLSRKDLNKQFKWSPKKTLILIITLFLLAFFSYLTYQYHGLLGRPNLEISSPTDNQKTTEEQITIIGKTNPDNSVSINGNLTQLNDQGEFNYRFRLIQGENKIVIEATNRLGRKTRQTRTVYFDKIVD